MVRGDHRCLGGGWTLADAGGAPSALALKIEVPWNDTNRRIEVKVELLTADGQPVLADILGQQVPIALLTQIEVGRPAGAIHGTLNRRSLCALTCEPSPTTKRPFECRCRSQD